MTAILSIGGAAVSAIGGLQQASAASAIADENARIQEANARLQAEGIRTQADILRSQTKVNYRFRAQEAGQARFNADAKSSQALAQEAVNATNLRKRRKEGAELLATQRGKYAAANIVESTGSPLSTLVETAGIIERDAKEQQYYNDLAVNGLYSEAALERLGGDYALAGATLDKSAALTEAKLKEASGTATLLSGQRQAAITRMSGASQASGLRMGAFGNLLTSGADIYKNWPKAA